MSEPNPELNPNHPPKKEIIKTWHAVAGGTAAGITPDAIKLWKKHEKLSTLTDPRNIFEIAHHAITQEEWKEISSENPDNHVWNPELTNRLFSFAPQILTIDGLEPTPTAETTDKKTIWLYSPGRPRKINPLGFYTVSGDTASYTDIAKEAVTRTENTFDSTVNVNMAKLEDEDYVMSAYEQSYYKQLKRSVAKIIGAEIIVSVILIKGSHGLLESPPQELSQSMGRRSFLKLLAGGASASVTAGMLDTIKFGIKLKPLNLAYSSTELQKETWQKLISYVDDMPPDVWIDGRTAMLIAKHEDAMNHLRENKYLTETSKGAIVMGEGHAFKAELFMHDKTSREAAIQAYAKHIYGIADRYIYDHYGFPAEQRAELTNNVLDYFSTVEINHVSDPGIPPGVSLPDYIDTKIQPVATFKSPQVENAIKSLRPK